MTIKGVYEYKHAIILNSELMIELDSFIKSKFSMNDIPTEVTYTSFLENGSKISFSSLDEMLSYDNSMKQKIKKINLRSKYIDCYINIETNNGVFVSYNYTVEASYIFDSAENELVFRAGLKRIFDKAKAPCAILYKFCVLQLFGIILFALLALYGFALLGIIGVEIKSETPHALFIIITGSIIAFPISYYGNKLWKSAFPPIVFLWGDEIRIDMRRRERRKNFFWGIIVTFVIGLVVALIANLF